LLGSLGAATFRAGSTSEDGAHYFSRKGGATAQKPRLTVACG
jgi:hypothetical protein